MKIDVSLDGQPVESTGVRSRLSWATIAKAVNGLPYSVGEYKITGFTATEEGLTIHWEYVGER